MARAPIHPSAVDGLRRYHEEEDSLAARLSRLRARGNLRLRELGELLGSDEFGCSKMEGGTQRIVGLRVVVLVALEVAFAKHDPSTVWGPRVGLTVHQRLARVLAFAYPDQRGAARDAV